MATNQSGKVCGSSTSIQAQGDNLSSSIPVPCNLVCTVDKIVQENMDQNSIDKDFLKTLGIDIEDIEDLRNAILQKSELLIAELT